jgi:hypothetical protein
MLGKELNQDQAIKLILEGKTDLIDGFRSKKNGRLFSAALVFADGKLGFEFHPKETSKK